jgi:hypothetical protein
MRRVLITGAAALALAVTGCGGDDEQQAAAPKTTAQTTSVPTPTSTESTKTAESTTPAKSKRTKRPSKQGGGSQGGSSGSSGGGTPATPPAQSPSNGMAPASSADAKAINSAVTGLYNALADGDGGKACSLLSSTVEQQLTKGLEASPQFKGKDCADILSTVSKNYPDAVRARLRGLQIKRVRANGDKAIAVFTAPGASAAKISVVREDGSWKVAALTGISPTANG